MKKYSVTFAILSILAILCFAGCTAVTDSDSNLMKPETKPTESAKSGNVSVKMFIPDYYTLTESRAIAPQTKYARLSYKNYSYEDDDTAIVIETKEIKDEDLTAIEGAGDIGLPGKIWNATFTMGCGDYYSNCLIIELLDGDKNVITSGNNADDVTIEEGKSASCSFFTVPKEISSNSGSLALNEMKFYQDKVFKSGDTVTVIKTELGDAEVIRFNADGTFGEVVTADFVQGNTFTVTKETERSYYGFWAKNAAVENYEVKWATYELSPKGVQNVIKGESLTYTLKLSYMDGTTESKSETFTAETIGENDFSVSYGCVKVDTKVNVLSEDYLTESITYMGNTYNGIDMSTVDGSVENVNVNLEVPGMNVDNIKATAKLAVSYPTGNTFSADGFFPLKLNVNNPDAYQFMYIVISNGTNEETYWYRGNPDSTEGELETRIWLRWGVGSYTVKLYEGHFSSWTQEAYDNEKNEGPNGVIYQGDNLAILTTNMNYPAVTFTVTNTRNEDGTWLYPSNVVQADDIAIMNKVADITYGLETAYDKAKAIHDWIVLNHYYDEDSLYNEANRKRQDAVAVMKYGMAVCEGYANLAAAMIRNCGIQVKYVSSSTMNHGWNHVNVGTGENADWRLLDCTWDDPIGNNLPADYIRWDNCLVENLKGGKDPHSASDQEASIGRSISIDRGHDDGTESIAY